MKNRRFQIFSLFAGILLFTSLHGCSPISKLYQDGDYYQATLLCIEEIDKKPNNKKLQGQLIESYNQTLNVYSRIIDETKSENNATKYDKLIYYYEYLAELSSAVKASSKASMLIPTPNDYKVELRNVRFLAAENFYGLALEAMSENTAEQSRVAYQHFLKADSYVKNYRDLNEKIAQLKQAGYAN